MENNNENKELHLKKNFKSKSKINKFRFNLATLAKNEIYYSSTKDFLFPLGNNSDLNTNYEKSNTSKNENVLNFQSQSNQNTLNIDRTYSSSDENLNIKILQVKTIIYNLRRSLEVNNQIQKALMKKYEKLSEKQITIEKTLEKIKRINKSKQKKHIKYLKYTPLNKVYYYCPKKIHYYYILMDLVIKSRKKNKHMLTNNFHLSLGGNNSNVSKKKDINRFKFNKKEDVILKKNLLFSSEAENIDWTEISREIQTKNAFQVFVRSLEISNFYAYKKWNRIEDNILRRAILYYGPKNWQQISYCLDGRNNSQCFHRWMKGINPKIKRNKWSFEEDLTLGVALKIYGNKKWSKIANHLNGRTDIQCRERFCNILDPNLEEVEWKSAEDIKLLSLYEKYGNKWSKIAKEFGNRTDNTCWRRWKYLISVKNFAGNFLANEVNKGGIRSEVFTNDKRNSVTNTLLSGTNSVNIVNTPTTNNYSSLVNNAGKKNKSEKKMRKNCFNFRINNESRIQKRNQKEKAKAQKDKSVERSKAEAELVKNTEENAFMNKNKLFITSIDKNNNFNFNKEIFLSNKFTYINDNENNKNLNHKANEISNDLTVKRSNFNGKYLRKRPRSVINNYNNKMLLF